MLQRELFEEELSFIVSNLKQVICMEDPELTGEFLQCLRILGVSSVDSSIWPLIETVIHIMRCHAFFSSAVQSLIRP